MSRRFLDHDPHTGTSRYFHYNDDGSFTIEEVQEVSQVVADNKEQYNIQEKHTPYSGNAPNRVASIPLQTYLELQRRGITQDPRLFKKWLNDPDNRGFRTRPGRV